MFFSIIIPTCNRNNMLALCLDKLTPGQQTLDAIWYEVMVTDDGKNNEAKELVETKYAWANWVAGPKKGPAANRNNGAKYATGDWLVFTDDDCLPDENWLQEYANAITAHPESKAFEGAILPDDWQLLKKDMAECPVNDKGGCFWSANIMVEKRLFEELYGFDERFTIAAQEDQQFKIDIEKACGKTIVFLEKCFVIHPVRQSSFRNKILQIPAQSKNFAIYALENKDILGYKSLRGFAAIQMKLHFLNTWKMICKVKIKSVLLSLAWLIFGVPINVFNYYMLRSRTENDNL